MRCQLPCAAHLHGGDLLGALLIQLDVEPAHTLGGTRGLGEQQVEGTPLPPRLAREQLAHTAHVSAAPHVLCAAHAHFSSRAIMISTVSRESAPRSTNLLSAVTCTRAGR